ncbi:hypothetical protein [Streptomyces hokutonensis]|uniref:hypothetical protein n=1 Tax=Streptomyces hokutonensis TaxID=1306990 RepID=UPI003828CD4A
MSPDETAEYEVSPHAADGIAVRRWDDEAKDPEAPAPDFAHFQPLLMCLSRTGR